MSLSFQKLPENLYKSPNAPPENLHVILTTTCFILLFSLFPLTFLFLLFQVFLLNIILVEKYVALPIGAYTYI